MEYSPGAVLVFAWAACIGGVLDAHMVAVMTIIEQRLIHTIKRIQENHQEPDGVIGINLANRHTGVEAVHYIRNITVKDS